MTTFYGFDGLPTIDDIKRCIMQIVELTNKPSFPISKIDKNLSDIDKYLSDKIINYSLIMFTINKLNSKSFTIFDDRSDKSDKNEKRLKNMKIDDDADGFSDETNFFLNEYFKDNLGAFVYLVAYSYVSKRLEKHHIDGSIFYLYIYSKYSGKKNEVFIVNKSNNFYIFEDKITNKILTEYINDYFGNTESIADDISRLAQDKVMSFIDMQRELTNLFNDFSEKTKCIYDFSKGAIMFLDFLGWKGLWLSEGSNTALEKVSEMIDDFESSLSKHSKELFAKAGNISLSRLISISDTIAIFTPKVSDISESKLLELHAKLAKYILEKSVKEKYPIRGAIAYGEYSIVNNIMIGPGIDECASWYEEGDWIGIHLTPSAQFIWNKKYSDYIIEYKIPLKSGIPLINFCIKWNVKKSVFYEMVNKTKALLPEIAGKYLNTYNFLEEKNWKEEVKNGA